MTRPKNNKTGQRTSSSRRRSDKSQKETIAKICTDLYRLADDHDDYLIIPDALTAAETGGVEQIIQVFERTGEEIEAVEGSDGIPLIQVKHK